LILNKKVAPLQVIILAAAEQMVRLILKGFNKAFKFLHADCKVVKVEKRS
jgi:hypothetical protein